MEGDELELIQMELKYCERCGGLWLRRCGSEGVYCALCCEATTQFPRIRKGQRYRRLPVNPDLDIQGQLIAMICSEGGNA